MRETFAVSLKNVSKIYRLYGSQKEQLFDVLGLHRLGLGKKSEAKEFPALQDISLDVPKGHRIGIIGRNGAGKTTLLKLICGNFAPTLGSIAVNGTVQALMSVGIGFHPEFTGMDNLRASLHYNGLGAREYDAAVREIVEFCELGEFIDQPFKTYSTGMQARLMFATATAVQPDILIIDEVLGAGDAYFIAKCKQRVERLVASGATMLLVSHSTQQVLELCKEVIWMDEGKIRMRGEALVVIKAYEEYVYGHSAPTPGENGGDETAELPVSAAAIKSSAAAFGMLQAPLFQPHAQQPQLPEVPDEDAHLFRFETRDGMSRWECDTGIKIRGFSIVTDQGITNKLVCMRPAKFVMFIESEISGPLHCRYGLAIFDMAGNCICRIWSQPEHFEAKEGELRRVEMLLNPNQIGPGEYIVSLSLHDATPLEKINSAGRYDLLNRSFTFTVELPQSLGATVGLMYHSAEWRVSLLK